jgi:hypothetical protein
MTVTTGVDRAMQSGTKAPGTPRKSKGVKAKKKTHKVRSMSGNNSY